MDKTYLKVIFEKGMYKNGGSIAVTLPKELLDYLDIEYDKDGNPITKLKLIGDLNKNGMPYIGLWNTDQQEKIREAQTEKEAREETSDKYDSEKGETWKGAYADMKINRKYKE